MAALARFCSACLLLSVVGFLSPVGAAEPANDKIKEVAGTAEFLRSIPKQFATLQAVDPVRAQVTLLSDGETKPHEWPLIPEAEVKVAGWWASLEQLTVGDRVWVWFQLDRNKKPVAIAMICDEISQQDINGGPVTVERIQDQELTLKAAKGKGRVLKLTGAEFYRGDKKEPVSSLKEGDKIYLQSAGDHARLLLDATAFETRRSQQQAALRKHWTDDGLPGMVTFLHPFGGEMEVMLDHEAMHWGRWLKVGDTVKLAASPPIEGVVKKVQPWRERTQLRLVVHGRDQADFRSGQRIHLHMTAPPAEVDSSPLPPDLDRPRSKEERLDWFLASIYCTCPVGGDGCTGDFYTLASCNVNACGMPKNMRKIIGEKIDKGLTDKQIFEELLKERGPNLLRPHLQP